ncbi:MAG TPA: hypothetical protein VHO66_02170, partial [Ruminiclostridium sp.]|nr:hypothetical protein [Ruminiclostridium sp.]
MGALIAAGIILFSCIVFKRENGMKIFIFFMLADLSWFAADILWAADDLIFKVNRDNDSLASVFYTSTSFLIITTFLAYIIYKHKTWKSVQLIVDTLTISISLLWTFWILFYKNTEHFVFSKQGDICNGITIFVDIALITSVVIWYLSIRRNHIPVWLKLILISTLLFSINDLYCYVLYMQKFYTPNSFFDAFYIIGLLGISLGVMSFGMEPESSRNIKPHYSSPGQLTKCLVLLILPIIVIIFKGFDLDEFMIFIFFIFFYEGSCNYIRASIKSSELLEREKHINSELENRISIRTKELSERTNELLEMNNQLKYLSDQDTLTN